MGIPPLNTTQSLFAADFTIHADQHHQAVWPDEHASAPEPHAGAPEGAAQVAHTNDPHPARQPILIADDEESISDLLAEFLSSEGYRAVVAHSGREALLCALRESPSLILCDWMMPGMSGAQLLAELRRRPATAHIPLVMMSSMRPDQHYFPGVPFLAKPFELDDVLDLVVRATRPQPFSTRLHGEG